MVDLDAPEKSLSSRVVIDGWWKLIVPGPVKPARRFAGVPEKVALFDLKADPLEKNNVVGEQPEVIERLTKLLKAEWNPPAQ